MGIVPLAISVTPPPPLFERFLVSPGFGGLMAILAAIIATTAALIQHRHNKLQQSLERWWQRLNWIVDKAFVADDKERLPQSVAISVLWALNDTSDKADYLQFLTIRGLQDLFRLPGERPTANAGSNSRRGMVPSLLPRIPRATDDEPSRFEVTDPEAITLLEGLRGHLEEQERKSFIIPARTYEINLFAALERITRPTEVQVSRGINEDKAILITSSSICWAIHAAHKRRGLPERILKGSNLPRRQTYRDVRTGKEFEVAVQRDIIITSESERRRLSNSETQYQRWKGPSDNDDLRKLVRNFQIEVA
jgi:hypothetical protein